MTREESQQEQRNGVSVQRHTSLGLCSAIEVDELCRGHDVEAAMAAAQLCARLKTGKRRPAKPKSKRPQRRFEAEVGMEFFPPTDRLFLLLE